MRDFLAVIVVLLYGGALERLVSPVQWSTTCTDGYYHTIRVYKIKYNRVAYIMPVAAACEYESLIIEWRKGEKRECLYKYICVCGHVKYGHIDEYNVISM